jgi:hypothetical protein
VLLVLGDCLQVGIVEPVHQQALIQQLQAFIQAVAIPLDQEADVDLKFVRAAALDKSQAFLVALLGRKGTFWRNAL